MLCSCDICSRVRKTEDGICLKLSVLCGRFNVQGTLVSEEKPSNDREEEIREEEAPSTPYGTNGTRRRLSLDSSENGRPIKMLKPAFEDDDESDIYTSGDESSEDDDEELNPERMREKILEYRAEKEALLRERARLEQKVIRMEAEQALIKKLGLL